MKCPQCGEELGGDNYCNFCMQFFDDLDESDFEDMINNGDEICLNCTYWSVNPHGAVYGMICRKCYPTEGPGDSCGGFVQEHYFASYGDDGQYQFNETGRTISNKLYYWKNNR